MLGHLGSSGNSTEPHLHFQVCERLERFALLTDTRDRSQTTAASGERQLPGYGAIGAQLYSTASLPEDTAEHRYIRPLQVAFHVPVPFIFTFELDISFSPGRHPVWPALANCSSALMAGNLAGVELEFDTQLGTAARVTRTVAIARN